jgi:AcrR family transcriptional regulator
MSDTKRLRGRPATFDRAAALDAAIPLFWQHGYDGTTIAMLTDVMGCTPPTLYSAFGSKERLYCEALEAYMRLDAEGDPPAHKNRSAYDIVEAYLRASASRFTGSDRGRGCMLLVGNIQQGPDSEGAARATAGARAQALAKFDALLRAAQTAGEIPASTDTLSLARFYIALAQGMAVQAADGANAGDLHALVDIGLDTWPRSLG